MWSPRAQQQQRQQRQLAQLVDERAGPRLEETLGMIASLEAAAEIESESVEMLEFSSLCFCFRNLEETPC